jgi:hypothetical protein
MIIPKGRRRARVLLSRPDPQVHGPRRDRARGGLRRPEVSTTSSGLRLKKALPSTTRFFRTSTSWLSFLYSADTTRFSINLGASAHKDAIPLRCRASNQVLNDEWNNSNADQVFNNGLNLGNGLQLRFVKLVVHNRLDPSLFHRPQ